MLLALERLGFLVLALIVLGFASVAVLAFGSVLDGTAQLNGDGGVFVVFAWLTVFLGTMTWIAFEGR